MTWEIYGGNPENKWLMGVGATVANMTPLAIGKTEGVIPACRTEIEAVFGAFPTQAAPSAPDLNIR